MIIQRAEYICFNENPIKCAPFGSEYNLTSTWQCYNGTNSAQGIELLKAYGDQTYTIDLSFVPSIEIDNVSLFRCNRTRFRCHQSLKVENIMKQKQNFGFTSETFLKNESFWHLNNF